MKSYILTCKQTGEKQDVTVCNRCSLQMPPVDDLDVSAYPADADLSCEFCNCNTESE